MRHRDEINAKKRNDWALDPTKHRERVRAWKKGHPEKKREQDRRYRKKHYFSHPRILLTEEELKKRRCQRARIWRKANPEKANASKRKRYYMNLDKSREQSRLQHVRYYSLYPEKGRAKVKLWRKNNPEKKIRQNSVDALRRYAGVFWSPPEELVTVETKRRLLGRRIKESVEERNG